MLRPMSHLQQSRATLTRDKGSRVKVASGTGHVARCVMARRTVARLVFGIERCCIVCDFDARQRRATKSQVWHRPYVGKPFQFAGMPQTRQQISTVNNPKFTTLWGHVKEVSLFNKFFFWLLIHALAAKIQPDKVVRCCQNGHTMCASMVDIQSPTSEIRRGKKKKKKKIEITGQKYNGLPYYIGRP